jgi:hypothetical protein
MARIVNDLRDYTLLENLVSGSAVSVNLSTLSRVLGKHRNTVRTKVESIFSHRILHLPVYPFTALYRVYPLLVVIQLDLPEGTSDRERFETWIKEDPFIFAAFRSRQGDYDTILFVYHEDITSYQLWMESQPSILRLKYGVSEAASDFVSSTSYFSNQRMIKYEPSSGIELIKSDFKEKGRLVINGYELDEVDLKILSSLVAGDGMKTNYTLLVEKTGLHRKTIEKRVVSMIKDGVVSSPVCRFPNFFVPPKYILTYSLLEVRSSLDSVIRELVHDPHVPIGFRIIEGKYNLLLFGNHSSISDHIRWEDTYRQKFPGSFGSANITYLTPEMTISFDQQLVSLSYIKNQLKILEGKELRKTLQLT